VFLVSVDRSPASPRCGMRSSHAGSRPSAFFARKYARTSEIETEELIERSMRPDARFARQLFVIRVRFQAE